MSEADSFSHGENADTDAYEGIIDEVKARRSVARTQFVLALSLGLLTSFAVFMFFGFTTDADSDPLRIGDWAPVAHDRIEQRIDSPGCLTVVLALMALMTSVIIAIRAGSTSEGLIQEVDDYLWRACFNLLSFVAPVIAVVFAVFSWFGDLSGGDASRAAGATISALFTVLISSVVHRDRSHIGPAMAHAEARQRIADHDYRTGKYANLLALAENRRPPRRSNVILVTNLAVVCAVYLYGALVCAIVINLLAGGSVSAPGWNFFAGSFILIAIFVFIARFTYKGFMQWIEASKEAQSRLARWWRWIRCQIGSSLVLLAVAATLLGVLSSKPAGLAQYLFSITMVAAPVVLWAGPYVLLAIVNRASRSDNNDGGRVRGLVIRASQRFMRPLAELIAYNLRRDHDSAQHIVDEYTRPAD